MMHGQKNIKRILPPSCLYACLSAFISSAPNGRISIKFVIGDFHQNLSAKTNLVKMGHKYWALYTKNQARFIVEATSNLH